MSLDINMKDVKLIRDDDGWIYISKDGIEKTTKLLLDDGKSSLENIAKSFQALAGYNNTESMDKTMSMIDWFTTLGLSFYGAKNNKYLPC